MARMFLVETSDDNRETWECTAMAETFEAAVDVCKEMVGLNNELNSFFKLASQQRHNIDTRIIECNVDRLKECNVYVC